MNDIELLERHKPVLMFDPQYDYRALSALSAISNPGNLLLRDYGELLGRSTEGTRLGLEALSEYEHDPTDFIALAPGPSGDASRMEWEEELRGCIYGRAVPDGGRIWLQYWYWLYYNPKNLFGFGKHEGDWEMIQIGLGDDLKPQVASFAQHSSGEARPWREGAIRFKEDDPHRPLVFVAPLSHASYFEPGTHPYVLGIDDPRGDGPAADLPLAEFGDWALWPGRWGNPERAFAGRLGEGPQSPGHQGSKWETPAKWHNTLRYRKLRVWLGRLAHRLGAATYPHRPTIRAERVGDRVIVDYDLASRRGRRGRHLYVTLHEGHLVLCSRRVANATGGSQTSLRIPEGREPTAVMASTYNKLRQRSDPVRVELG